MRDMETDPYSRCEARIAQFCQDRGISGHSDDPVGFVLDHFSLALEQRFVLMEALRLARGDLSEAMKEIDHELAMAEHPLDVARLHSVVTRARNEIVHAHARDE